MNKTQTKGDEEIMKRDKVYCEDCKWKERDPFSCKEDPATFCNNPKTFEQSAMYKEGVRKFCISLNNNNDCSYFEVGNRPGILPWIILAAIISVVIIFIVL